VDKRIHVDCRDVFGAVELLEEGGAIGCRDDGVVAVLAVIAVVTVAIIGVVPKVPVACEITSI